MVTRDLRLTLRARRHGAHHAYKIIKEARAARIPISWAFALVQQESDFRNIFGSDRCSILHGAKVTASRVRVLIRHVANGGTSNGVGLTQLTSIDLIKDAERRGGAHKPRHQLQTGFRFFKSVAGPDFEEAWHYNGAPSYQPKIAAKQRAWHRHLT